MKLQVSSSTDEVTHFCPPPGLKLFKRKGALDKDMASRPNGREYIKQVAHPLQSAQLFSLQSFAESLTFITFFVCSSYRSPLVASCVASTVYQDACNSRCRAVCHTSGLGETLSR